MNTPAHRAANKLRLEAAELSHDCPVLARVLIAQAREIDAQNWAWVRQVKKQENAA